MVVDSSAIIAILRDEPEARWFRSIIGGSDDAICSMVTFVESYMVATGRYAGTPPSLHHTFLSTLGIGIAPTDEHPRSPPKLFFSSGKGAIPPASISATASPTLLPDL
ncbi:type II toxin-antitoxin system VapC family toxin [Bosea sp. F3-2]|uniref:type II toxin-antitoxin system VapC family toxin n=1 Tax=Bosea sp. F3-2 TaxID=2599640 RepID=UPI0024A68885|nr:type II toxin-antitoxin system VapC family toxin [Bosea sp. F3-2]